MAGSSEPNPEVFSWLKSLPVAPEYHPTLAEFQDPISYIFKIEKEASKYGICKIVPPVLQGPKKTAIANLNKSLAARAAGSGSAGPKSPPTFTTRQQQIGFCPRKPRPVQKPVWQSGEYYTFQQFEAKAKNFERNYLKKCSKKGGLSALEIETLYWKATVDKPFSVQYANDMPGSAFVPLSSRKGRREASEGVTVGETEWNMRSVSRAKGSLLRFMKEEIPGVTSPMVYVAMLFSWFAWHVEDHDLHSLNYMHMGAGKTWYGVPRDAAVAFEEVIRIHGYGGEVNPLVTFATLGEKTTVMSPEVFISAGIPCCRLVQNTGEFVVTFPRAYHSGFSHGFNFGEAANIATPEWLTVAKDAAIRRASINYPPMVSHFQLLYDLALALCSRIPMTISAEPRSSRLKDKKKGEGEAMVKEQFVQNVIQNNDLLHVLGKGSRIVLLPHSSSDISVCSSLRVGQLRANPRLALGLCSPEEAVKASKGLVSNDTLPERNQGMKQVKGFYPVKGKFAPLYERSLPSLTGKDDLCPVTSELPTSGTERESTSQCDGLSDQRLFSCVTCGILTFTCVAIIQPREAAAKYLMSADCSFFNDWIVGSGVTSDRLTPAGGYANDPEQKSCAGRKVKNASDGLYDVPVQSADYQIQTPDQSNEVVSDTASQRDTSALGLLASTYGNSSDSEEDQEEPDVPVCADETISRHCSPDDKLEFAKSKKSFAMRNYPTGVAGGDNLSISRFENGEEVSVQVTDLGVEHGCPSKNLSDGSHLKFDRSVEYGNDNHASARSSGFEAELRSSVKVPCITSCCSPVSNDVKNTKLSQITITGEDTNTMFAPRSDDDSSRIHVFCLEHAKEVEQQLRPIGGVNMLLLCHPDYPKIEAEAKSVAEELRIDHPWNDVVFEDATKEDEERIQSALDGEEAIPGNGDWTVKLGINLYYSANLSRSPLYSKQMPFNSVIYNAFGRSFPASSPTKPNVYRRRSVKQKKVVVGKWCGKVWMSNQVHPFLVQKDPDEQEHDTSFQTRPMPDVKPERNLESVSKPESTTIIRQYGRKRKLTVESGSTKKVKSCTKQEVAGPDDLKGNTRQQRRKLPRSKQAKHVESEAAVSDDLLECNSEQQHRNQRSRQSKCIERKGADSDDGHQQRRPITRGKRAKRTEIEDAVSDGLQEDDTHQQHRTIIRGKQAKHFQKEDDVTDDSMEDVSHQQDETDLRGDQDRCMDEDVVSDDSLEHRSHWQLWRAPRDKQAQNVEREENSDDSMEHNSLQQYRRALLGKQAKCFEKEEYAMSDDSLERHSSGSKQFKRVDSFSDDSLDDDSLLRYSTRSGKQAKSAEREDAVSDDSLEFKSLQQHKMSLRGKQTKCVEQDVSDDSQKHNLLQQRRTLRGKQAKCVDREDAVSDDSMEHNSLQQHRRTLRGKQARCFEKEDAVSNDSQDESCLGKRSLRVKQKKQENSQQTRQDSARLRKTPRIMKPQTPRQMKKETPRPRNVKFEQDDELDLFVEGGPSTRLRKRIPKPVKEAGTKEKEKQQKGKKKVKNAPAGRAVMPYNAAARDEEDEYQCDIEGCTMSFGSKQELVLHKRNVCPVKGCGKKFFSHKYLVQHRRVHTDDRPLKCPWKGCKMSFKWAWARTEHIRVHTGARPYVCAEAGCGQTFRFVSDFSRHKRKTGHSVKKGKGGRR